MKRHCASLWLIVGLMSCAGLTTAEADVGLTITLDRPAHFTAPDGSDVQLPSTSYRIEQAGESSLRLVKEGAPPIEIQATKISHDEIVTSPTAVAVVEEGQDDTLHLLLVLPGGQALDAAGSYGDVKTRGFGQQAMLKAGQVTAALNQVKPAPQQTSPPPPIGVVRVPAGVGAVKPTTSVKLGAGKWINWTYLQINQPLLVAEALADVQAGKRPRAFVAGLATPMELNEILKTNWAAEAARLKATQQAAATTRGISAATPASPFAVPSIPQQQQPPSPVQREASTAPIPLRFPVLPNDLGELGAAYSGEHVHRWIILRSPVNGHLTAQLRIQDVRDKRFRIDEVITYTGDFNSGNGDPQRDRSAQGGDWNDIRPSDEDPSIRVSMAGYVRIDVKAGQLIYLVVAFEPHASIGPPVGRYEVPLELTWHASSSGRVGSQTVPLRAYCNGIHFGLLAYAEQAYAITLTDRSVDYPIVVTNSGSTPISGSFSALQLPSGVTMNPASVTVGPNSSQRAVLRFNVNRQGAQDGPSQDIAVSFNSPSGNRPINLSIGIYHPWIWWCFGRLEEACATGPDQNVAQVDGDTVAIGGLQAWIQDDGQWWWKIKVHNWKDIDIGGTDFRAILRFNAMPSVADHIDGNIGPITAKQFYEHLTMHPWIHDNYLSAAMTGFTLTASAN